MLQHFRRIFEYRGFIRENVTQIIHSRYRGSVLGVFWTVVAPMLLSLTFAFIFSHVNGTSVGDFLPYFLAGNAAWTFFASATAQSTGSIIQNNHFVSRVFVPKAVFPLSTVAVNFVDLLGFLVAIIALIGIMPGKLHWTILLLPLPVLLLAVFVTGIALITATVNVLLRDFQFVWSTAMFFGFFLTPVLFLPDRLPPPVQACLPFNVMYPYVRMFQELVALGTIPSADTVLTAAMLAAVSLAVGVAVFQRWERRFYMYV